MPRTKRWQRRKRPRSKTRTTAKAKATKPATKKAPVKKATPTAEPGKTLSQFQAAVQVLAQTGEPMTCKAMVEAMTAKGLWSSLGGKTPEATLYASILRDTRKGSDAQFRKADGGLFTLASKK